MHALVTGGTGLLGSRLARLLIAKGARVAISYRPGDSLRAVEGLSLEHRPADLLDQRALERTLEGVEVVFHAAALVTFRPALYDLQMTVNVEGTRRLLAAMERSGARRLVHVSTVNTLGVPPPGQIGDEDTPFDWQPYRLGYMDSKRAAEELVLRAARSGLAATCVLPGTLFGPGDVNWNAGTYIRLVDRLPFFVAPPGGTVVAHVDDVARGALLALERGRSGERYILGGEPVLYRDLFAIIAGELGRRPRGLTLPASPLRVLGRLAGPLRLPLSAGLLRAGSSRLFYSSRKAERELGWSFRPARLAVRDAVRWYREAGLLPS